ncbi:Ig-like domain repeat protein [Nonlabens sp. SY33080]|uniref:Ig-like domain repeat protein n=1 Tax=Nonlabens sp. SY33080 TaxID=2719911 RepID=UPI001428BB20|nr:Ig-like domain repeat protein [Nonlabens sp. SY33080]
MHATFHTLGRCPQLKPNSNENLKRMKKTFLFSTLIGLAIGLTNCSSDDDANADTTAPTISIQSPDLNQTYSTDLGNGLGPELVNLTAQGVDETRIATMQLTVTNSSGTVVLEDNAEATPNSDTQLTISENFSTNNAGTYNVVFTATDASGNVTTSSPRTFTYQD